MDKDREEICRKLRVTVAMRGRDAMPMDRAVVIGPHDLESPVGGHQYLQCLTLGDYKLCGVDFKTAREFEDA